MRASKTCARFSGKGGRKALRGAARRSGRPRAEARGVLQNLTGFLEEVPGDEHVPRASGEEVGDVEARAPPDERRYTRIIQYPRHHQRRGLVRRRTDLYPFVHARKCSVPAGTTRLSRRSSRMPRTKPAGYLAPGFRSGRPSRRTRRAACVRVLFLNYLR